MEVTRQMDCLILLYQNKVKKQLNTVKTKSKTKK